MYDPNSSSTPQRLQRPTPRKVSDLLTAFGASRSPSSVTKMQRETQQSAKESSAEEARNEASTSEISAGEPPLAGGDDAGDMSSDDIIHGMFKHLSV